MYGAGEPVLQRAQEAAEIRPDVSISDVLMLVSGVVGVNFADDEQRERVMSLAMAGLRP